MDKTVLAILNIALAALGRKVLTALALLMTFGLAMYTMWQPDWTRFAVTAFFGIVICFPLLKSERGEPASEA